LRVQVRRSVENDVDLVARRLERACDHFGRAPVSSEGIDRYARHYGAEVVSGSMSRPLYVLQFGHT
jgi:hypothetical protein